MKKSVVLRSEDGLFGDYIAANSNEKECTWFCALKTGHLVII